MFSLAQISGSNQTVMLDDVFRPTSTASSTAAAAAAASYRDRMKYEGQLEAAQMRKQILLGELFVKSVRSKLSLGMSISAKVQLDNVYLGELKEMEVEQRRLRDRRTAVDKGEARADGSRGWVHAI